MSKFPKLPSWVEREFPRKVALEIYRQHWRWMKGKVQPTARRAPKYYEYGLKRTGRIEELAKFRAKEGQRKMHIGKYEMPIEP